MGPILGNPIVFAYPHQLLASNIVVLISPEVTFPSKDVYARFAGPIASIPSVSEVIELLELDVKGRLDLRLCLFEPTRQ